jgi:tetratricopeptide (TPR) repeat protein
MEYDEITKIASPETSLYEIQADILIQAGGDDEAIDICKKAIDLFPESPHSYNRIAGIYHRKARYDEAETFYKKAIAIDPDSFLAHLNMGIMFQNKGLINESVVEYEKAIELDRSSVIAYNNLAFLCATKMQDKMDYARKLAQEARDLAPKNASILDTYAWICYLNGEYEKSISELKNAVTIAPQSPVFRYHLGAAYYKKGLKLLAIKELEYALRLSSNFPEAKEAGELIEEISLYGESNVLGY